MLLLAEWAFFAIVGVTFAGAAIVLVGGLVVTPLAVRQRVATGNWPAWGGRLAAALAIAATAIAPIALWVGLTASQ